jgi:hypothetical protein
LVSWLRGDAVVAAREAACRAAGVADPEATLYALDLAVLARTLYDRRDAGPVSRPAQAACAIAVRGLQVVAASSPPAAELAASAGDGQSARVAELAALTGAAWSLSDDAADAITREALAEIDKRLAPSRRAIRRFANARPLARWRGVATLTLLGALLTAIVVTTIVLVRPKNVLAGKAFRTSTASKDFDAVNHTWKGGRQPIFFMTNDQAQPWIEYDLGKPTAIRRVVIQNRPDCCRERAIPLVVEVGDDQLKWREVARATHEFFSWEARFPTETARYVRLRVDRSTIFHLEAVEAFAR